MYSKAAVGMFLGVLLVVVPVLQGAADDPPPGSGKRSTVPVLYKPPRVGIPGGRLGGARVLRARAQRSRLLFWHRIMWD
jgi:hypothetical protein